MNNIQAGQVKYKTSEWEELTSSKKIIQNVKCKNSFWHPTWDDLKIYFQNSQTNKLRQLIKKYKYLRRKKLKRWELQAHSESKRFKPIYWIQHCKIHGLQDILKLVTSLCKIASLDIKNAYYSVSVDIAFKKI